MDNNNNLEHSGILGMKWGVWNEETRARYMGTGSENDTTKSASDVRSAAKREENIATITESVGRKGAEELGLHNLDDATLIALRTKVDAYNEYDDAMARQKEANKSVARKVTEKVAKDVGTALYKTAVKAVSKKIWDGTIGKPFNKSESKKLAEQRLREETYLAKAEAGRLGRQRDRYQYRVDRRQNHYDENLEDQRQRREDIRDTHSRERRNRADHAIDRRDAERSRKDYDYDMKKTQKHYDKRQKYNQRVNNRNMNNARRAANRAANRAAKKAAKSKR